MNGNEHEVGASFSSHPAVDEDAARIGERTLATWQGFDAALAPIIGSGGIAALYRRSLFLSRAKSPWLPGVHESALDPVDFKELQAEQETHATAHHGGGLGIGLSIVRELTEAHGGSIAASSRGKGFGSKFVITLPREQPEKAP